MARTARAVVLEKQATALSLVRSGRSYAEIAEQMGYADRSGPWKLVTKGLKTAVDHVAEDYLQLELSRLDALQVGFWDDAVGGDRKAAEFVLSLIAARIRLLGLDKGGKTTAVAEMRTLLAPDALRTTQEANRVRPSD